MDEWRDQCCASLLPSDEPLAPPSDELPVPPLGELSAIPPPLEVCCEQVIEDDLVVQIEESDGSGDDLEWIDDPRKSWTTRQLTTSP